MNKLKYKFTSAYTFIKTFILIAVFVINCIDDAGNSHYIAYNSGLPGSPFFGYFPISKFMDNSVSDTIFISSVLPYMSSTSGRDIGFVNNSQAENFILSSLLLSALIIMVHGVLIKIPVIWVKKKDGKKRRLVYDTYIHSNWREKI